MMIYTEKDLGEIFSRRREFSAQLPPEKGATFVKWSIDRSLKPISLCFIREELMNRDFSFYVFVLLVKNC
jgi:hypothetical protein